jgi:hypothetical protein
MKPKGSFQPYNQPIENFLKYIKVEPNGCWLWLSKIAKNGYGHFTHRIGFKKYRTQLAHRFSFEYFRGPIPYGLVIDHTCKVQNCVNPYHMETVTQQINVLRGNGIAAKNHKKTHCLMGHELSGENLYKSTKGKRECIMCRRASARKWRHDKKSRSI